MHGNPGNPTRCPARSCIDHGGKCYCCPMGTHGIGDHSACSDGCALWGNPGNKNRCPVTSMHEPMNAMNWTASTVENPTQLSSATKWTASIMENPTQLSWTTGAIDQLITDNPQLSNAIKQGIQAWVDNANAEWEKTDTCPTKCKYGSCSGHKSYCTCEGHGIGNLCDECSYTYDPHTHCKKTFCKHRNRFYDYESHVCKCVRKKFLPSSCH